jgi:protein-S-isoprenylcysteine O-methyltransferase Ste14
MNGANLDALVVRGAATYLPLVLVVLAATWRRPSARVWAAVLVASVWNVATLLALNVIAQRVGWWEFDADVALVAGIPADLWLGWALLWGALPVLVAPDRALLLTPVLLVVDLVVMPLAEPVVRLGDMWLVGEAVALLVCLVPGLVLATWTARDANVVGRSVMQLVAFTGLVFYVLPSLVFTATGEDWSILLDRPRWHFVVAAVLLAPFAAMALQAMIEFAQHGGTPLPLDPPKHLVMTGPYAYVANPMQLGATVLVTGWGVLLGSPAVVTAGGIAAVFSSGLAAWNENGDLAARFGDAWRSYRASVRVWRPRWKPIETSAAAVYVARTCDPCSQVGAFLEERDRVGLDVLAAESHPQPLRRITYESGGTSESGVAAVGRSLEHVNLAWAVVSWIVRLPVIRPVVQLINDAVGGEPRDLVVR